MPAKVIISSSHASLIITHTLLLCIVSKAEVQSEFQELKTGFSLIEKELKTQGVDTDALLNEKQVEEDEEDDAQQVDDEDNDTFRTVISEFYKEATKRFKRLELLRQESMSAYEAVVKYYGEDPGKLHPDAFFGIFKEFVTSWEVRSVLSLFRFFPSLTHLSMI